MILVFTFLFEYRRHPPCCNKIKPSYTYTHTHTHMHARTHAHTHTGPDVVVKFLNPFIYKMMFND